MTECSDYKEVTYTALQVFKNKGIRIICEDKDITDMIGDLE